MYVRTPHHIITELDEKTGGGFPTDQNFFYVVFVVGGGGIGNMCRVAPPPLGWGNPGSLKS